MLLGTAILSIGLFNGVMLSFLLWFQKKEKFLGFGVFVYCMLLLKYLGYWVGFFEENRLFAELLRPMELLMGPVLLGVCHRIGKWELKREWLHYLPFGILLVVIISFNVFNLQHFGEVKSFYGRPTLIGKMSHQMMYFLYFLSFRDRLTKPMISIGAFFVLQWVLTICFITVRFQSEFDFFNILLFSGMAVSVNYLAFLALSTSTIFNQSIPLKNDPKAANEGDKELKGMLDEISELVQSAELFLNTNLKVSDLAENLKMGEKQISRCINEVTGENFNSYLNRFRVSYAEKLILDPEFDHYTIDAIGMESGFANKVSFYKAFKRIHGVSPSNWKKSSNHSGSAILAF